MLSTAYRIRLIEICDRIARGEAVELNEMIWAEKLGKANRSAGTILRQARRKASTPSMQEGDMDDFLNQLDLGHTDPSEHRTRFDGADDIADFFRNDDEMRRD